jgi:transcription elongation factor GreA
MDTSKLDQPGLAGTIGRAAPNRGSPPPLLTPEEYERYGEELARLREIRDRDLRDLLRQARTFVANDAAEEVVQIQEDQAVVGARIERLEDLLATAQVIDGNAAPQVVTLGRSVEVEYLRTGKVASYLVAGVLPSPAGGGTVSAASPIGAALMGRSPGDIVAVELPRGRVEDLRIVSVRQEARVA